MCCGEPEPSLPTDSTVGSGEGATRFRPTGSRRRQLEWLTNFFLVVVSLFGVSVGSGLMAFYKLQLLSFISVEFAIVPAVLLGMAASIELIPLTQVFALTVRARISARTLIQFDITNFNRLNEVLNKEFR